MMVAAGTWIVSPFSGMGLVVGRDEHYLQIVFEDGYRLSYVPECIVTGPGAWRLPAREAASDAVVAEWKTRGEATREIERAEDAARLTAVQKAEREWKAWIAKNRPADAVAIMVAELVERDCDSQSDHYGTKTQRRVFLAWSWSKRDSFREMRKAAATFAETADLASAGKDAEHREKYSMGHGYYLKASDRYSAAARR